MIPTYEALMLPVLKLCAQHGWVMRDLINRIADDLALSDAERAEETPSGGTTTIASRVHWAKTYLKQAGLLEQPKRGVVQISRQGRSFLNTNPTKIDLNDLRNFPEFIEFLARTKERPQHADGGAGIKSHIVEAPGSVSKTPDDQIEAASVTLTEVLRETLLSRILEATPAFFERLIIDLLLAMGYGGSRADAAEQLGGTGDGGVDGVIREDQLGLDRIYLQAKRYQPGNSVGSEAVQAFIGALVGRGAQKGVLITTSTFSKQAVNVANQSGGLRIVLIDGAELTRLMINFNVAVRIARTIEVKRIDLDYFEDTLPE